MTKALIVIPARYGSTRFPGKPLALIKGKPMIAHVIAKAQQAAPDIPLIVATDDDRIAHCANTLGVQSVMTPSDLATGSDRVLAALKLGNFAADVVLNLQGDAPLIPVIAIKKIIEALVQNTAVQVATPVKQLTWDALENLQISKQKNPYSGTTVTLDDENNALWFSKLIIPALRKIDKSNKLSPVYQHLGLYGFRRTTLEKFVSLREGKYEALEGLEQLRLLENRIPVHCVTLPDDTLIHGGIDSPDDLVNAEQFL